MSVAAVSTSVGLSASGRSMVSYGDMNSYGVQAAAEVTAGLDLLTIAPAPALVHGASLNTSMFSATAAPAPQGRILGVAEPGSDAFSTRFVVAPAATPSHLALAA